MRDWSPERALPLGALDVDVDPLMVVGRVGETVDPVLSDLDPVRRSQRAADEVPEALDTFSGHLRAHVVTHLKSLPRTHAAPWPARSEERRVGKECVSTCRSRWSPYQ